MATAKTEILTALVVDAETGEEITRELSADEIAELATQHAEIQAQQAAQEARANALEALIQAQLNA